MLPFVLIAIALVGLVGLFFWRSKHASSAPPAPVAASNHKSVRSFNYGPTPVEPAAADEPAASQPNEQAQAAVVVPVVAPALVVAPVAAAPVKPVVAAVAKEPVAPAAAVSALDMLGDDELPAPKPVATDESSDEAEPDRSLFYNPFTAPAPTANDEANRLAEVELRKQQRAARRAGAGAQKEALTTLYKQD